MFLQLYKKHKEKLFYFKRKHEVDFCIPEENLLKQDSISPSDIEIRNSEIIAHEAAMGELQIEHATIITYDEEENIEKDNYSIQVIPAWKWLLKNLENL